MTGSLFKNLPPDVLNVLRLIGGYADQQRISCYLVGGVVRDLLLGRKNLDLDIVVESDAIEFCKLLAQKYQATLTVYPRFKTATLTWPNHFIVDFTSARKEIYVTPGSLPVIEKGSLRDDVFRRDFTVNAMVICLNQDRWGDLIDLCGGEEDLCAKKIRVFHPKSFQDDPTRLLRAIRFQERYRFQLAKETEGFLQQAVEGKCWATVTPGRYFEEFRKILKEPCVLDCLRRLEQLGAFQFLGDDFHWTIEKENDFKNVDAVLQWLTLQSISITGLSVWLVYFIILVRDHTIDAMRDIVDRLSLSRHDGKKIISFKLEFEVIKRLDAHYLKPSQIYNVLKSVSIEELIVFLVVTRGQPPEACIQKFLTQYRNVRLCLKGDDLMRLGMRDGKRIGATLQNLLEKKIDSGVMTKEEELQLLEEANLV